MTDDQILDELLGREGEGTPPYLSPGDAGGRTSWGISERAHPDLWQPGPPTRAQARARLYDVYAQPFSPLPLYGVDDRIRVALIDDATLSGVSAAVKRMQWVVGVALDGWLGPITAAAIAQQPASRLLQRYVVERAVRLTRLVQRRPSDLPFLTGWVARILSFLPEAT